MFDMTKFQLVAAAVIAVTLPIAPANAFCLFGCEDGGERNH